MLQLQIGEEGEAGAALGEAEAEEVTKEAEAIKGANNATQNLFFF